LVAFIAPPPRCTQINDPGKEFLLPIDLYVDKTSKTSNFTASHGEPTIMMMPFLTLEHDDAWRPSEIYQTLNFLPLQRKSKPKVE
jgi:hypothetical protein